MQNEMYFFIFEEWKKKRHNGSSLKNEKDEKRCVTDNL